MPPFLALEMEEEQAPPAALTLVTSLLAPAPAQAQALALAVLPEVGDVAEVLLLPNKCVHIDDILIM